MPLSGFLLLHACQCITLSLLVTVLLHVDLPRRPRRSESARRALWQNFKLNAIWISLAARLAS
jgi:hypothetical protein